MFQSIHKYISIIGDAYSGQEKWQFGLRALALGVPTATNQAAALAIAPLVEAWWRDTGVAAGNEFGAVSSHRLTELKVAEIGQNGEYTPETVAYSHFYVPSIPGVAAPQSGTVPQATVAITLTTGIPRGLASKGRIYLPPSSYMVVAGADGQMPDGNATRLRNSIRALINAINNTPEVGPVMVMSKGKSVATPSADGKKIIRTYPNPGVSAAVTGVSVGQVVDTQRRRRRSLVEAPLAIAL